MNDKLKKKLRFTTQTFLRIQPESNQNLSRTPRGTTKYKFNRQDQRPLTNKIAYELEENHKVFKDYFETNIKDKKKPKNLFSHLTFFLRAQQTKSLS